MDFFLGGHWMCARVSISTWRFHVGNRRWGLVIWIGPPRLAIIPNGCEIGPPHGFCVRNFWSDPGSVMWRMFGWKIPMDPNLAMGSVAFGWKF